MKVNNLFVFAKEKTINDQIKKTLPSFNMVNETDQGDGGKDLIMISENQTASKIKETLLSQEMVNESETDHSDKGKDVSMISGDQTTSKIKIKLKMNRIFQQNCPTKNISSNDIYSDQSCQKKISREGANDIIKMKFFECLDCQFTTTKKSTYENHLISKKHYLNVNNIQPYLCEDCNINLINKSNYLRHIKNIHNIDTDKLTYTGYYLIEYDGKKCK